MHVYRKGLARIKEETCTFTGGNLHLDKRELAIRHEGTCTSNIFGTRHHHLAKNTGYLRFGHYSTPK